MLGTNGFAIDIFIWNDMYDDPEGCTYIICIDIVCYVTFIINM